MALTPAPRAERRTGMAAPTAMPMITGKASSKVMAPVAARACKIPTVAEALWSTAVKIRPTATPMRGLEKVVRTWRKPGDSRRGSTAELMAPMPNMRTAKPRRMELTWSLVWDLENIRRRMPMMDTIPDRVAVDRRLTHPSPPWRAERETIQPVTEVPRMAPRMIPMACRTFIIPALTKPTTMTEVAEEDWMTAVTPVPSRTPLTGVEDNLYRMSSSLLPATFFSPSPMRDMPKRKRATPLSRAMTLLRPMVFVHSFCETSFLIIRTAVLYQNHGSSEGCFFRI